MANDNIIESIHRYLLNEMEEEERLKFEEEAASNEAIKKQINMEKRFLKGMEYAAEADLKTTIANVHQNLKKEGFFEEQERAGAKLVHLRSKKTTRILMAVAATLTILLATWFIYNKINDPGINTDAIYANYYQQEISITNTLIDKTAQGMYDPSETKNERLRLALDQYSHSAFAEAVDILTPLRQEFPNDKTITFYLGLSHIGLGDTDKGIELLTGLSEGKFEYQDAVKWYLGLALVKNQEIKKAKQLFNELITSPAFSEKAQIILDELNK